MAAAKSHRYLGGAAAAAMLSPSEFADQFEFDESDVWAAAADQTEPRKPSISNPRPFRKPLRKAAAAEGGGGGGVGARSLPVNVPDWSKILRSEYTTRAGECTDEEEEEDGDERMPPHEYLARTRVASLSVHEGIGRTLKGRDLSRVRNAIWKKTGFED